MAESVAIAEAVGRGRQILVLLPEIALTQAVTSRFEERFGVVPGIANVDPHGYVKMWNLMRAGKYAEARAEQERLLKLFEIVWISLGRTSAGSAGVGAFKTAMRSLGIIATNTMARPQRALNGEEAAQVDAILRDVGLFG